MTGTLIELDLAEPWQPPEPAPGGHHPARLALASLVAALLVAGATASAPPGPSLDPLLSVERADVAVVFGPDGFYLYSRGLVGQFAAYRPGGSEPLWAIETGSSLALPRALDRNLIVLDVVEPRTGPAYGAGRAEVRDGRNGRLLWQTAEGGVVAVTADLVLIADTRLRDGDDPPAAQPRPERTIKALDRRTGEPRWSRPVADGVIWAWESDPARKTTTLLTEVDAAGRLRVSDAVTDAERLDVQLDLTGTPTEVEIWGDVALVRQLRHDPGAADGQPLDPRLSPEIVSGLDLATGHRRWTVEDRGHLSPCGEGYLCSLQPPFSVIDPLTGDVVFRSADAGAYVLGDRILTSPSVAQGSLDGSGLFDLRTRKQIRSFRPWSVAGRGPGGEILAAYHNGRGELTVGILDVDTGAVDVVGRTTGWIGDASCERAGGYLGCIGSGGVRIWPVPPEVVAAV